MPDKRCLITGTALRHEVKKVFYKLPTSENQKHSVSISLFCSGFSFYEHFTRQFTVAVFYIQNRKMCLSKNILCQYFAVFCPAWDSFSSENILYVAA